MQRRLNLACALIHEPRLLLLDEPTAGVDPQSRENLLATVGAVAAAGTTIFYTTHYIEEAERLCDRIAILDDGRIVAAGTRAELLGLVDMDEVIELRSAVIPRAGRALVELAEVVKLDAIDGGVRIHVESVARALGPVARVVQDLGGEIESLEVYPAGLQRVFLQLTGKALRD
jgi:ABC-2 type transport system ATP-binding protein